MGVIARPVPIDIRPRFRYIWGRVILAREGRFAGGIPAGWGEDGACGRACTPLPGGPGIMPAGIMTGVRGASLEVGLAVGGVTPAPWTGLPTKPGPDRTKGPHPPWEEPWWNAGRRARPTAEGRRKPPSPWRAPHPLVRDFDYCVCRRSASLLSFVLLYFVIAGLDPAIHAAARLVLTFRSALSPHFSMDHRVKPGGDEESGLFDIAGLRSSDANASRERWCLPCPAGVGTM